MSRIDEVLAFLSDGEWHDLSEVTHTVQVYERDLWKIIELLSEFNFVRIDEHMVCIDFDTKKFLESVSNDLRRNE